jgi:uncharacterized protein YdhG (YjbR/CyaY superfamily)
MAKTNYTSVDEYIKTFPPSTQKVLHSVRKTIKEVIPDAEEVISYQIPTFKLNGKYIIYFAGWANHISVYPKPRGSESLNKQLAKFKGGKGTVQFPLDKPIPLPLVKKIVKYRLKDTLEKSSMNKK